MDGGLKAPHICVLGNPCSGKSKVVEYFVKKWGLVHIDVEQLLKEETMKDSPLSIKSKEALEKGE